MKGYELTKRITSIVEILKDMNPVLNQGNPEFYTIPETREMVAQIMLLYGNAGGEEAEKWIDYDYRRLRFMVDMENYNSLEAKRELMQLKHRAEKLFPDANVTLAGSIAQFTVMQNVVSLGQILSFLIAMGFLTGVGIMTALLTDYFVTPILLVWSKPFGK